MAFKLNKAGCEHAAAMIRQGLEVEHETGNWNEVRPTSDEEARYLDTHDIEEYGLWFLGINTDIEANSKEHYVYPYGDFNVVQKSGLIAAEQQAKKDHSDEIANAARTLLELLNQKKPR